MTGDCHVRFCERLEVRPLGATRLVATQQIQILHRDASSKAPCQGQESAAKSDAVEVWGLDTAYGELTDEATRHH